jgi:AcrR family transcriptional regulator
MRIEDDRLKESRLLALTVPQDAGERLRRQRILDAMADAIAAKTFSGTTIADIVGRAGISRATFYKQFPDKRLCFEAAVDSFVAELHQAAARAHSDADPLPEVIRKASAAVLELLAAKPAYAQLALIESVAVEPTMVDRYRRIPIDALTALWAPGERPKGAAAEMRMAFGRAQVLICTQIAAGHSDRLRELLPDVVYIAMLPLVGPEEALRQAQLSR